MSLSVGLRIAPGKAEATRVRVPPVELDGSRPKEIPGRETESASVAFAEPQQTIDAIKAILLSGMRGGSWPYCRSDSANMD